MPAATNPNKEEFYVYQFRVYGRPFYVGVGRSTRAPDRKRYVKSLLTKANKKKLERSAQSIQVMAELIRRKENFTHSRTRKPLNRRQALELEKKIIGRLLRHGIILTNRQLNPYYQDDPSKTLSAILRKQGKKNNR